MLINWFTVVAQIINFLILVFLLHRFLYGPIVRIMDEREETIKAGLKEASRKKEEARQEREEYSRLKEELEKQRSQFLQKAEKEAQSWYSELKEKARQEVMDLQEQWRQDLERERDSFLQDFRYRAGEEITRILKGILKDLAGRRLEEEMVKVFLEKLENLSAGERKELMSSLGPDDPQKVLIRSSGELDEGLQKRLKEAVQGFLGSEIAIEFQTHSGIICGIELRAGGHKVSWNIDEYLQSLVEELSHLLTQEEEARLLKEVDDEG